MVSAVMGRVLVLHLVTGGDTSAGASGMGKERTYHDKNMCVRAGA